MTPLSAPPSSLFADYAAPAGAFDEVFSAPGVLRPQWQKLAAALEALSAPELARRWEQAQRLVRENGITFNAFDEPTNVSRPWQLDALPLVVPALEWQTLSSALEQRARLLNLILADLYGPQRLLRDGHLPAELLYANPKFRRPLHGVPVADNCYLHFYAADLARSPEGQWWVLGDRTEAPSGAGYALENRLVISRMLPNIFHEAHVERLAPYFIALQESLANLAPRGRENPRIVLLTPGPSNKNYFEDSYLARYLGYTLVEGGDLTVRDERVMLKTLGGLMPVDVILRRVRDDDCDPLELRGDSTFGVPGLLQAVRAGNVAVANPIGSSLVQSPAFMAYLPGLCRKLLGEELQLPCVATWWCGEPTALTYVLDHLDGLIVKSAFGIRGGTNVIPGELSKEQRAELIRNIKARPHAYAAREQIQRSYAPVWLGETIQPWNVVLRTYAVASGDGNYQVMPGGLTRATKNPNPLTLSISAGEASKDAWVLSEGPVRHVSLLQPPGAKLPLRRGDAQLSSRVADHLMWLGRHVERAESEARLLRTVLIRLTSESESSSIAELPVLLRCLADQGQIEPGFVVEGIRQQLPQIEKALPKSVFDQQQAGSLRHTVSEIHRMASIVRDRLSFDSWRIVNRIESTFRPPGNLANVDLSDILAKLNHLLLDISALSGMIMESMTRQFGWRFLEIGRRLERSLHIISLARTALVELTPHERAVLEAVLEVADSSMTYRSRYLANLRLPAVLDLILIDETNPRALAFQLVHLADHVEHLPREANQALRSPDQRISMALLNKIRLVDVEALCDMEAAGRLPLLDQLLESLASDLPALADVIGLKYFIHAGPPRQMGS